MRKTLFLLGSISWGLVLGCGEAAPLGAVAPSSGGEQALSASCEPAWNESAVYVAGDKASIDGVNYQANWWTQGQNPTTNSGTAGSGQPWAALDRCGAKPATTPTKEPTPSTTPTSTPAHATGFLFSPYKDVAVNANWNTNVISTKVTGSLLPVLQAAPNLRALTWSFATGECGNETWGGISGTQLASANVSAWASAGKDYILSTGGAAGAFTCGSDAGFSTFLDRYASNHLIGVDFDIEAGQSPAQIADLVQRVKTAQANPKYAALRFSFTVATLGGNAPQSLGDTGAAVLKAIQAAGLHNYIINLMTMDYGSSLASNCTLDSQGGCDMGQSAVQAAINLNAAWKVPFSQIELTPMIGGNDTQAETFTLRDVNTVMTFARQKGLAGLHMWSLDRDNDCAPGYASPTCNTYGEAGTLGFLNAFTSGL